MTQCASTFLYRPLDAAVGQTSLQCKHDRGHDGAHAAYVSPTLGDVVWTTPAAAKDPAPTPSTDDLREQIANVELAAGEAVHDRDAAQREVMRLMAEIDQARKDILPIVAAVPEADHEPTLGRKVRAALETVTGRANEARNRVAHLEDECRALCECMDRIRYAAGVDPDTHVDDLIEAVAERVRERDQAIAGELNRIAVSIEGGGDPCDPWSKAEAAGRREVRGMLYDRVRELRERPAVKEAPEGACPEHADRPCMNCWTCSTAAAPIPNDLQTAPKLGAQEAGEPPAPRVFHNDEIPDAVATLVDRDGGLWRRVRDRQFMWQCDSLLYGIASVVKDFGPLTEVLEDAGRAALGGDSE